MGFEKTHLFGKVEVDITATTPTGTLTFYTDLPGNAMAPRFSLTIPICTRRVVSSRLPGNMQGHLISATYTPSATSKSELYGVRVWARELPDGQWGWFPLPVIETPVEYQAVRIPVEPTPESFSPVQIPVEPTPLEFARLAFPVEPTPESFSTVRIPVEPTPEGYSMITLPVKPTPPVPQWVSVPVDE
jgi:hypothetical protein